MNPKGQIDSTLFTEKKKMKKLKRTNERPPNPHKQKKPKQTKQTTPHWRMLAMFPGIYQAPSLPSATAQGNVKLR